MKIYSSNLQVLANGHSPRNAFVNTLEHIMFKDVVDLLQVSKTLSPKMKSMVLESSYTRNQTDLPHQRDHRLDPHLQISDLH